MAKWSQGRAAQVAAAQERAVEVGGTLKIVSVKNKGTRLEVKVPMILNEGDEHD